MPERATSMHFAETARRLAHECRARGLVAPSFRSPPAVPGVDRTLRRRPDGGAVVAVRVRDRAMVAVVADLVEGVLAANEVEDNRARGLRHQLLGALGVKPPAQAA